VSAAAGGAAGHLAPGNAGAGILNSSGDLTLGNAVFLDYDLGLPDQGWGLGNNDGISVVNLTLNPNVTLTVTPGAGFGPGKYHLIRYTTTLTDNSQSFSGWSVVGTAYLATFSLDAGNKYIDVTLSAVPARTWDANTSLSGAQDGEGNWDTTTNTWWTGTGNTAWSNATPDTAVIGAGGTAGTITLTTPITSRAITFAPVNGNYTLAGSTLTLAAGAGVTVDDDAATIASGLTGASWTKAGAGTLTLSGADTFSGATLVANGALNVAGTLGGAGAVAVGSGGTLAGTGTVNGAVAVVAGATLAPGTNAVGTLTLNSGLAITGATFAVTVSTTNAGGYGQVAMTAGNVQIGAGTLLSLNAPAYTPANGDLLWIVNNAGGGTVAGTFSGLLENAELSLAGRMLAIHYSADFATASMTGGNDIVLAVSPATQVCVETAADGSGTVVPLQSLPSGSSLTCYAIARDAANGFVANVAADSWALVSRTGGVVPANLVVSGDRKSATFTGAAAGSAGIEATSGNRTKTASGTITVTAAAAAMVRVETAADGSGSVVPARTLQPGSAVTGYAIARDAAANFVANVAASWALTNATGGVLAGDLVASGDGKSATFTAAAAGSAGMAGTSGALATVPSGIITVPTANTIYVPRNFAVVSADAVTGTATLVLQGGYASANSSMLTLISPASNTFSGDIVVDIDGGTLTIGGDLYALAGFGQQGLTLPGLTANNTITIRRGGCFAIDDNLINSYSGYVADRLGSAGNRPKVSLAGGTLTFNGANYAVPMAQTLGDLTLASGNSVINAYWRGGTPQLVCSSLTSTKGSFVNFVSGGANGATLGSGLTDARILFTTPPAVVGGNGAAGTRTMSIVPRARAGNDLVCYDVYGIRPLFASEYSELAGANDINVLGVTENVKMVGLTTPFAPLTADKTINSLVLNHAGTTATWALMDKTLTLTSGQLLCATPNNYLTINSGVLTAGAGSAADLDITVTAAGYNTLTINANINDNGSGAITLVKNGVGSLVLGNAVDNTYSGGTFVNEGALYAGSGTATPNRRYLGTGPVTVDNATLYLRSSGATGFNAANQAGCTVLAGGQVLLGQNGGSYEVIFNAPTDRFDVRANGILSASVTAATPGWGLNSLTRVSSLAGISGGQAVLAPGAIVAFIPGTTALGVAPLTLGAGAGTAGDLYFGLAGNTIAASTITVGTGTPWLGISTDRTAKNFVSGTITANSDFNLQGLGVPGVVPVALSMGTTGPVAINTPNNNVNVNVLGAVSWSWPSTALGSNNRNISFIVTPGATFTLNTTNALGASPGSMVSVTVQDGGMLAVAAPNSISAATTIQAGGKLNACLAGGLTGSGALTFASGSIIDIYTPANFPSAATGFSGPQAAAATINPGTIVRLNVSPFGSAVDPLDTYLGTKSPIYELYGAANWAANPVAANTTVMTLNKDANGVGGMLVNDTASRDINPNSAVPNGVIVIGPNGGTIAATTNTTLTIRQPMALGANALTIGATNLIDHVLLPKLGTVQIYSALGYITASPGSSITIIPGATLINGANAIPDAADIVVNGTWTLAGAETIGSLAGSGIVDTTTASYALTVGRNNNGPKVFSGILRGTGAFTKTGTGRLDLTQNVTVGPYAGAVTVNGGTLALSGNGTLPAATGYTVIGDGVLMLDNTAVNVNNRVLGTAGVTFQGGTFRFLGAAGAASSEALGAATFSGGASTIDITNGVGGSCEVMFSSAAFSGGTVNFTASGGTLGLAGNNPRVYFSGLTAGLVANATVNGVPAYYDTALGIRAMDLVLDATEFDGSAIQTGINTKFTAANTVPTLTGIRSVNSIWINSPGAGKFINLGNGSYTLTIASGLVDLAGTDNFEIKNTGSGTLLTTGTTPYYFGITNSGTTLTISVPLASNNPLYKSGPGALVLNAANTGTGAISIDAGTMQYATGGAGDLAGNAVTIWGSGQLDFNGDTDTLGAVTIYSGGITNTAGGGNLTIGALTMGSGPAGSTAFVNTRTGTLTLGGTVTFNAVNDPNMAVIAGNLALGGARSFVVNNSVAPGASVDLDVQAVMSGTANISKDTGTGTMRLSANNTFAGTTTINAGTLIITKSGSLGPGASSYQATVANNSTLALDGSGGAITLVSNFPLNLTGAGDTLLGPISGPLVNLAGNNTVQGAIALAAAAQYVPAPQIASLTAGNKLTLSGGISGANALTVDGGGDTESSGSISTVTTLTKNGAGTLTLSGSTANAHTGLTTVNGGKLFLAKLSGSSAVNAIAGAGLTINNGGVVQYAASSTNPDMMGTGAVTINGTGQLDFNGASDTIGAVTIVGTGATTNTTPIANTTGGGNLTIGSSGTALTITPVAGCLSRINSGTGTNLLGGDVTFTAATTGRAQISGNLALNGATRNFAVGSGTGPDYDLDIDAVISGTATYGIAMTGSRLRLSGVNTYPGDTTITSGTLKFGNVNAIPNGAGKGNVVVTGTLDANGINGIVNGVSGAGSIDNSAAGSAALTVGANNTTCIFGGVIKNTGGALSLIKTGTGALTLSGANTFTGGLFINSGTVTGTVANALGGTGVGSVTIGDTTGSANASLISGAALTLANPITARAGSSGVLTLGTSGNNASIFSGPFTLNNILTLDAGSGSGTVTLNNSAPGITGSGTLRVNGGGTASVTLSGVNSSFAGNVVVNTGSLKMGIAGALNASNTVAVNTGATFDANAFSETIGGITNGASGGGTFNNSGAAMTLTLGGSSTNYYSGSLTATTPANLALVVALTGSGKQIFAGSTPYVGATTINSGRLVISNALASAVTVNGGTLAGSGPFNSVVTVRTNGHVAPADTVVGTLVATNGLVLNRGAVLDLEFRSDLSTNDVISVTGGAVAITNGPVGVNLYAEGSTGAAPLTNGAYNLIKYAGAAPALTNLFVANPAPSQKYAFDVSGGYVRVLVSFDLAPQITTTAATNVTPTTAFLNGFLVSTGAADTTVSVYWGPGSDQGTNANAPWAFTNAFDVNTYLPPGGMAYTTNLTGLTAGQTYSYRYCAINANGTAWGGVTNFVCTSDPGVDNGAGASSIGTTSAALCGTLLNGTAPTQVRIYWGTTDGGTDTNAWNKPVQDLGTLTPGAFAAVVSGLQANGSYWYRCYATNSLGESWSAASTNFTTLLPGVSISEATVLEGAASATTSMLFTVSLSAVSAANVTMAYAASNGTALVSDNDYVATNGSLTIPAGSLTAQLAVVVIGDNIREFDETLFLNLSALVNATNIDLQGMGIISNDDWTAYVRGDGLGSDTNSGGTWATAWASISNALVRAPLALTGRQYIPTSVPNVINVQASAGAQAYDVAARNKDSSFDLDFEGGWQNVDVLPAQTGMSLVKDLDGTVDEAGISLTGAYHSQWRRLVVNRFVFTNVTRGVEVITAGDRDSADIFLTVSNTTIRALNDGLYINYPKAYGYSDITHTGSGGAGQIWAVNVDITAGLGGSGNGIVDICSWGGSLISAAGTDPATGVSRVSVITAPSGTGVYFTASADDRPGATFECTVIHSCGGPAIQLDAMRPGNSNPVYSNRVQAVLSHCTLANNAGDGLQMSSVVTESSATVTDCIFANNAGSGINLLGPVGTFACAEGYDVFFNDDIQVSGAGKALAVTSSAGDPLFKATGTKPAPWYCLGSTASPAYKKASDGSSRGAYQNPPPSGIAIFFW
jgi:autotransporter-associated beta strand protein